MTSNKVLVIGLDSASPSIVFDHRHLFPTLNFLMTNGVAAKMRSTHPPITVPAWISMCTGLEPGTLGIYGFRHRKNYSYTDIRFVRSKDIRKKTLWNILGNKNKSSFIMGVPPSYPPQKIKGELITCFMTPDSKHPYTYPPSRKKDLKKIFGPLIFDVGFRTKNRDKLLGEIYKMTNQHFDILEYMIPRTAWDFLMFVEIGVDRIHHAFWKFHDAAHRDFVSGNRYQDCILDYYRHIDKRISRILQKIDQRTTVIIVSDHGAKAMKGCFCINEWLIQKGYLVLKNSPTSIMDLEEADVAWKKTLMWGWGGYYARIFLNVKGRERHGMISKKDCSAWIKRLKKELGAIRGPRNERWSTRSYIAGELYQKPVGDCPDLFVYLDDLSWRSAGTVGHHKLCLGQNDTGPDDAVHDWDGIFIAWNPSCSFRSLPQRIFNQDFAPSILSLFGEKPPRQMEGRNILRIKSGKRLLKK